MKLNFSAYISKKNKGIELGLITIITIFFILFFYKIFNGQLMLSHDSIRWYGVYHFFADSLLQGVFPYWDPYDFCGQPFYYNLGILRLYEPITLGFIFLYKFFHISLLVLYHWEYMFRVWFVALGAYLCYRQVNRYFLSNLLIFFVFLFSSFTITCFRQNGVLYTLFWVPWVMYFLLRLLKNFSIYNIIGFSFFVGLSLSSYQGVYLLTYIFIFILTLLINNGKYLISIIKNSKNLIRVLAGVIIIIILALPLFSVAMEQNKIVPTARLDDAAEISKGIGLSYQTIGSAGTHSNFTDFIELIVPVTVLGYYWGWPLNVSECFLYIGIFPLLLSIIGIFLSKGKYHINFLLTLILIGLLMLGPKGGVHGVLYFLFYPLRVARHMHLFSGFFLFTLLYFVGQGAECVLEKLSKK